MGNKSKKKSNFYQNPEYFENRELSWLDFNYRVLSEAKDASLPLLERLKFLSITASNLDEFYMIRVASLKDQVHADYKKCDIAGMLPAQQLEKICEKTHELVCEQYGVFNKLLLPKLVEAGIHLITKHEELDAQQGQYVDRYFKEEIYPVLTPMAVDSSRPFPLIRNNSLNIGALLADNKKKEKYDFATVQVPGGLPRFVEIPGEEGSRCFILLEQIIERNIRRLFLNYRVICAHPYRIMRNADLTIDEDEAADLLMEIEKQLKKRQWGEAIRLEVEAEMDRRLCKRLRNELSIKEEDLFRINGPIDLTFLMKLYGCEGFEKLKNPPYIPQPVKGLDMEQSLFPQIRKGDILLSHPYQSFEPVVRFVEEAARDKQVLAIKQTLYRVSSHSPIIAALAKAAENGKQVSVLVELKARFDEENNILWAKKLEQAGCHVIYGLVGLKTHSKITLVVRREEDGIRRYVHLGTGNYNDSTAKLYTDMGIFTSSRLFGEDATAVFNMLSGYSEPLHWNKLTLAPLWLRDRFTKLIERERDHALAGRQGRIIAKMNSLCDAGIIASLYEASAAGVKIDLIVRGICCLRTGILKISENITVHSIVGNFLEHSRIYYFENDFDEEIYMGSADWMPRNLDKRVEILFPVEDEAIKKRIKEMLRIQLEDDVKRRVLGADGVYYRVKQEKGLSSQDYFCKQAMEEAKVQKETKKTIEETRRFEPLYRENQR